MHFAFGRVRRRIARLRTEEGLGISPVGHGSEMLQWRQVVNDFYCLQADGDDAGDEVYDVSRCCFSVRIVDNPAPLVYLDTILTYDPLQRGTVA